MALKVDPTNVFVRLRLMINRNTGGLYNEDTFRRLVKIMKKNSNKLVYRNMYILILNETLPFYLNRFMDYGGWNLIFRWLENSIKINFITTTLDILTIIENTPMILDRLMGNVMPTLIYDLSKTHTDQKVQFMCKNLVEKWIKILKPNYRQSILFNLIFKSKVDSSKRKSYICSTLRRMDDEAKNKQTRGDKRRSSLSLDLQDKRELGNFSLDNKTQSFEIQKSSVFPENNKSHILYPVTVLNSQSNLKIVNYKKPNISVPKSAKINDSGDNKSKVVGRGKKRSFSESLQDIQNKNELCFMMQNGFPSNTKRKTCDTLAHVRTD